ncbi:MAG: hypothetical protein NC225_12745 [Clostridium sp.]|nr:hypothetical protein [Clostridium sp.]MCM1459694.1 hypothetical protein [Bacteroides sp.]
MARSRKCLDCVYCRQIRYDDFARRDYRNNYTCDYMLITHRMGNKGNNPDKCLLFKKGKGKKYGPE